VERHFTINGTSGFKLKTATGKVVSTKRAMLDEITDFYALQLDNPVNVLTQDMARQFLNSSSSLEKYKFFMKGIQLEQLDHDYTLLSDSLDGVDAHLESLLEDENALKVRVDQAEKKLKQCDRQENLREKMLQSQRQMAWAQVEEQERNEEQARHKVEEVEAKIAQRVEEFDKLDESFQRADQAMEAAKAKLEEVKQEHPPLADQQSEAKAAYSEKDADRIEIQTQQRDVAGQLRRAKQRATELEQKVNDERKRLEAADGGNQARMLQDIEAAEIEAAEAKRKYDDHPAGLDELERKMKTAELKRSDAADALQRKQADVADATTRLRNFQQGQGAHLGAYHQSIHAVIREINAERRWRVKPVGPLGEHMRILKPEWSSIIENFFGNALGSFVVEQKSDQALLSAIMQRCG
jgi:chromosome segregation ATPase